MARQLRFDLGPCLFFGDNLDVLPAYIADETIDLVYLDPPFNSNRSYNAIFKRVDGTPAAAQIKAFDDTWHWSIDSERAFRDTVEHGGDVSRLLLAFRDLMGTNDMLAYLTMMAPRMVELHRVLKPNGSLFLHCDDAASHYLKVLLDAVFGPVNFHNEIIWKRTSGHSDARRYGRVHDTVLFFAKGPNPTWNDTYQEYDPEYVKQYYRYTDEDGRKFMSGDLGAAGLSGGGYEYEWEGHTRVWRVPKKTMQKLAKEDRIFYTKNGFPRMKRFLDEAKGMPTQDLWTDIEALRSWHREKLGYPTQKPLALLERIITACSNEGDVVLDPFCGCGTAIDAAQKLNRRWIGIDITEVAIRVIQERLGRDYSTLDYSVRGIPTTMDEVDFLAERDKYAFQQWVCDRLGIDADIRKGADHGIDGELVRYTVAGKPWRAVVSVKGGGVNVTQIRDLRGTVEREKADTGIFVTRKPPTKPMVDEAVGAGLTDEDIPRIQILTAADLIAGRAPQVPLPTMVAQRPIQAVAKPENGVVPTHKRQAKAG